MQEELVGRKTTIIGEKGYCDQASFEPLTNYLLEESGRVICPRVLRGKQIRAAAPSKSSSPDKISISKRKK
jgi:hypothetical protein